MVFENDWRKKKRECEGLMQISHHLLSHTGLMPQSGSVRPHRPGFCLFSGTKHALQPHSQTHGSFQI